VSTARIPGRRDKTDGRVADETASSLAQIRQSSVPARQLAYKLQSRPSVMSFRLRPHESVSDGLQRLVEKELRSVRTELGKKAPTDDAIHEARKSIKKVRALFRLVHAEGGRGLRGSRRRLRKVNRLLSRLRDAAAQVEILDALREKFPETFDVKTFSRVRRLLRRGKLDQEKAVRVKRWTRVVKASRELERIARRWKLNHRQFDVLAPGIRDEYKRGRDMMRAASEREGAKDFHAWRKRLKNLWYDLRLVEEYDPEAARLTALLKATETWLGNDHNVALLCARIKKVASRGDRERVRNAGTRYQHVLRAKALKAGSCLYSATPRATVGLAARAWRASQ